MRTVMTAALLALLGWAGTSWAGICACLCNCGCSQHWERDTSPQCVCPCDCRLPLGLFASPEKTQRLLKQLCEGGLCERLEATKKLGCRVHADFCKDPCVLNGLLSALFSDKAWQVRRAAAWGIRKQGARTDVGILALYLSSQLDPHAQVRWASHRALELMMLPYQGCETNVVRAGNRLVTELRHKGFTLGRPETKIEIVELFGGAVMPAEGVPVQVLPGPAGPLPPGPVGPHPVVVPAPGQVGPAPGQIMPAPVVMPAPGQVGPAPAQLPPGEAINPPVVPAPPAVKP